jgi:hypothetical protein
VYCPSNVLKPAAVSRSNILTHNLEIYKIYHPNFEITKTDLFIVCAFGALYAVNTQTFSAIA